MKKPNKFLIYIIGLTLFLVTDDVLAQGRSSERPDKSSERPGKSAEAKGRNKDIPGVPIDGGVSALLASGVLYGLKKLHDFNKKTDNKDNLV